MKKKKDAKAMRKAIKSLKSVMMDDSMRDLPEKLDGKMAVKVMADSPEGLKKGLEKAEELMEGKDEGSIGELLKEAFKKRSAKKDKEEYADGGYKSVKAMRKENPEKTKGMSDEELKDISPLYRGTKKKYEDKFGKKKKAK